MAGGQRPPWPLPSSSLYRRLVTIRCTLTASVSMGVTTLTRSVTTTGLFQQGTTCWPGRVAVLLDALAAVCEGLLLAL